MTNQPTLNDVMGAQQRIAPYIRRTPLLHAEKMDRILGCETYLKPEMLQITGSFKLRGAMSKSLLLTDEEKARGLIASSSGNHAQALAYTGKMLGARVVVVVNRDAPAAKIEATRALGAEVLLHEGTLPEKWAYVDQLIDQHGYTMVHACDDPIVMAGQGTIALEVLEDLADVDTFVVPLGGGGLLCGIAAAAKGTNPRIRVVGVEAALAPKYYESRRQGKFTVVEVGNTMADGVKEGIPGQNAYPIIEEIVDEIVLADEAHIAEGLRMLGRDAKLVAEGAAAVGIAAVLQGSIKVKPDEKVCFVLSAGNWELEKLAAIYSGAK